MSSEEAGARRPRPRACGSGRRPGRQQASDSGLARRIAGGPVSRLSAGHMRLASGWSASFCRMWTLLALCQAALVKATPACSDAASCRAKMDSLARLLDQTHQNMQEKAETLKSLEHLRSGILSGRRVELPSVQRRHLVNAAPVMGAVSLDARHPPASTNFSKYLAHRLTLAPESRVLFQDFLQLKAQAAGPSRDEGQTSAWLAIDQDSQLSVYSLSGQAILDKFALGHAGAVAVAALAKKEGSNYLVTSDGSGEVRVHKLVMAASKEKAKEADQASGKKALPVVTAKLTSSFTVPGISKDGTRTLTALLVADLRPDVQVVAGDSDGGLSVFYANGTRRARVRVASAEEAGGVRGLLRAQGSSVLFYTAHSFGTFSLSQLDVLYPPCTGWSTPLAQVAVDPKGEYARVLLSLEDGDVLAYSTTRGKTKACDLSFKFPRVSGVPMQMRLAKGHAVALPLAVGESPNELLLFNIAAMEAGYGAAPSRALSAQLSLGERRPLAFAMLDVAGFPSEGGKSAAGKSALALTFEGASGVELYEFSMKQAQALAKAAPSTGASGDLASWLEWFPKFGIFGIVLVGVVVWNVRKATAQKQGGGGGKLDDFDESDFLEQLKERKRLAAAKKEAAAGAGMARPAAAAAAGSAGSSSSSSSSGGAAASSSSAAPAAAHDDDDDDDDE
eukprot:TRINITY_DN5813_c0_g4_i1.p1 TRINITY_DN5813_c0_g4~~TRINITY_DN5813_c0_g4_i1.p1  ORF type:complete len:676 (+),score=185.42 TRINITY_DN5813_c0_g4_i1:65-2092(+)